MSSRGFAGRADLLRAAVAVHGAQAVGSDEAIAAALAPLARLLDLHPQPKPERSAAICRPTSGSNPATPAAAAKPGRRPAPPAAGHPCRRRISRSSSTASRPRRRRRTASRCRR
jgi:hypothetical protein